MAKVLNYDIQVSEFEIQLLFFVHFRTTALKKDMISLIPQLWIK